MTETEHKWVFEPTKDTPYLTLRLSYEMSSVLENIDQVILTSHFIVVVVNTVQVGGW